MARRDALLRLHKSLMGRRDELRKRLGGDLKDLSNSHKGDATGDSADLAFDSGSEEVASQLAELESRELAQIERALAKLKQGTYGLCEGTGNPISKARLEAQALGQVRHRIRPRARKGRRATIDQTRSGTAHQAAVLLAYIFPERIVEQIDRPL